ncbi:multiheme c-type cytochrome [Bradyrhizobium sp.]|uniref:multiheme c-type cytochrome n=1 Tax=Bradyrhizobium sp. TaxID=376 RepID=UPI00345CD3E3
MAALSWLTSRTPPPGNAKPTEAAGFVGSNTCAGCHQAEAKLWQASQHAHAMDHATDASVRGDFNDAVFDYAGTRSRFFRKDGKFFVETDGPDGKLATFEAKYTFGIEPLQQYLIEFPNGRIQALSIAWDTRPKNQGGQRWFHLYPNSAITHDDPLHWTKLNQNWNHMCAECHSTGVKKNYNAAQDRFATSFAEISVGCEACHGAGSRHVEWAKGGGKDNVYGKGLVVSFDERAGVSWPADPAALPPKRSAAPAALRKEVETCGLCHSRRAELSEGWVPGSPLSDTHAVSLLDRRFFEADGQIRDEEETYNYLPFKLGRMFAAGVTCSDCHEPHSAKLRMPGDGVCLQCHTAERYAADTHSHHLDATPVLGCPACHMPARTYMVVDRRHDHAFRVPRPDLSVQIGAPNACNDCHRDKSSQWAAKQIETWFGPSRSGYQTTYAGTFHEAWTEQTDAESLLRTLALASNAPAPARASALVELAAPDADLARRAFADPDPMVRIGALDMLEALPAEQLWLLAASRLSDPVAGVRIRAAELLASVPKERRSGADAEIFARAAAEFVAAQRLNADRPEARTALGSFYARQGDTTAAEMEYRAAIQLDPSFSAAAVNLSDLYRQLGRDEDSVRVLRAAMTISERDASLHHALGLALVRERKSDMALAELRRAAELEPGQARYAYVYAVGLNSAGRVKEAFAVIQDTLRRHPNDRDSLSAAIAFARQQGNSALALEYAERLVQLVPDQPQLSRLVDELRNRSRAQ